MNGFLGSHLAKSLKDKFEIIGLANSIDNLFRIEGEEFKVYSSKNDSLEAIFLENEIFAIIHVATVYKRPENPIFPLLKANILLPIQLIELAVKYKISVFVNTDTFFNNKCYSYSYLPEYTLSKRHSLEWVKLLSMNSACKVVNMKVFHMYGPGDAVNKFIPFIIGKITNNTEELDMTSGVQTRDFVYVKDVVSAYGTVLETSEDFSNFEEFEIGSGNTHSVKELAELIKKVTKSNSILNFGVLPQREGEIMESKVENFNLLKYGWKPKYSLEEGLKDYLL